MTNRTSDKWDRKPPNFFECKDCRCLHPTQKAADECCKGRHSRDSKDINKIMKRKFGI